VGIYPRYVHELVEICEIPDCQEQSVKVNAFLYVVTLCLWSGLATHGSALMLQESGTKVKRKIRTAKRFGDYFELPDERTATKGLSQQ